jgi:hypothetical protein
MKSHDGLPEPIISLADGLRDLQCRNPDEERV